MVDKLDIRKEFKELYTARRGKPVLVKVPKLNFLMVDGSGHPEGKAEFEQAMEALYGMAYTLKFMCKLREKDPADWTVAPLEGLWWMKGNKKFDQAKPDDWRWTMMVMQPKPVTAKLVEAARAELREKKDPMALPKLRFESFSEGRCAQILHVGPYDQEGPTIELMHEFIAEQGLKPSGKHHEIYMNDPRRTATEKLKTILRQPVE